MRIRELADKTGLASHTIRFYEKERLLDERFISRGENNYRDYSAEAVERVMMIKRGQSAGFTLAEIRELMALWDEGRLTPAEQIHYITHKIDDLTRRIADLERVRHDLRAKLASLRSAVCDAG